MFEPNGKNVSPDTILLYLETGLECKKKKNPDRETALHREATSERVTTPIRCQTMDENIGESSYA
jgi:hypothetical protein